MRSCPTIDQLRRLLSDELSPLDYADVAQHVSACATCQAELDGLTSMGDDFTARPRQSQPPSSDNAESGLTQLMQRLRDHPPLDWSSASAAPAWDSETPFAGPYSEAAPLGHLGPYCVLRELGSGATGQVYEARDSRLGRRVAIKVLRPQLAHQWLARARFEREARAVAAIDDQHLAKIFEVGMSSDLPPFMVTEFVDGESLEARLRRERLLPPSDAVEIARQIACGLEAAHRANIVHRDVKPSNVLLDAVQGRVKLVDFGLARVGDTTEPLTLDGSIAGTPAYMSPEQIQQPQDVDARSDVYSLGAILYEMLAGERPFRGVMRMVLIQALHDDPVPPRQLNDALPRDLETICLKALSKLPSSRYASAQALADDLQRWQEGRPVLARPLGPFGRLGRWCRRNPKLAGLSGVVACVLAAGLADLVRYAVPTDQLRLEAEVSRHAADQQQQAARQWQARAERLAQLLIFEVQDSLADQPESWPQRQALLAAALEQMTPATPTSLAPSVRQTLIVGHNRLGDLWRTQRHWTEAEQHYVAALKLIPDADDSTAALWLPLLANTEANLGEVALLRGDHSAAESAFRKARRAAQAVTAEFAERRGDLTADEAARRLSALLSEVRVLEQLAVCATSSNSLSDVVLWHRERLAGLVRLELLGRTDDESPRAIVRQLERLAAVEVTLGQHEPAARHIAEGLRRLDTLTETSPNLRRQRDGALDRLRLADLLWRQQQRATAVMQARRSFETLRRIATPTDGAPLLRDNIAAAGRFANYLIELPDLDEAEPVLERALDWSNQLRAQAAVDLSDRKSHLVLERNLAFVEFRLGRIEQSQNRLVALQQTLSELEQSALQTGQSELRDWVEAQRRELSELAGNREVSP